MNCWWSQLVARLRGIRNINEGERDRLGWKRKSSASPCSHCKSYLDRTVPRACHPSVASVYNVHQKGGVEGMLSDFCLCRWTEKEWKWVCSNLPHSTYQCGFAICLFTELWASSSIFGSLVLSHTVSKCAHCLMGNRSTQHFGVKHYWGKMYLILMISITGMAGTIDILV